MDLDQGGAWLMVFVGAVLLLVLGVFASLIQRDKKRELRGNESADSIFTRRRRGASGGGQGGDSRLPRVSQSQDKLIIPPPDEARIEAVAPKNDTVRRPR